MREWYELTNAEEFDSPALVLFPNRIQENILRLSKSIDDPSRLRPHVKTHKSADVTLMFLAAGISKFKCATIAEAEMLASSGAKDILVAYPVVGPKIGRLLKLTKLFPSVVWSCLCDNALSAAALSAAWSDNPAPLGVFVDLNLGMNRTGIHPDHAPALIQVIRQLPGLTFKGLHAYDGHLRDADFQLRKIKCDESFLPVENLIEDLRSAGLNPITVAGGSPTFPIHAQRTGVECSPGTFIYWDKGYESILGEQSYQHAAMIITRVISRPSPGLITTDLGHKSIAAENPLANRVYFLNAPDLIPVSQSEEHLVLKVPAGTDFRIGEILYGIPYHVCPTIALYDKPLISHGNQVVGYWETLARKRSISI